MGNLGIISEKCLSVSRQPPTGQGAGSPPPALVCRIAKANALACSIFEKRSPQHFKLPRVIFKRPNCYPYPNLVRRKGERHGKKDGRMWGWPEATGVYLWDSKGRR